MEENNDTYVTSIGREGVSQQETLEAAEVCETKERGRRIFFSFFSIMNVILFLALS